MDSDLLILLIVAIVILVIMIWWLWNLTRSPESVGPEWKAYVVKCGANQECFGRIWMDSDKTRLNYMINIRGIRSNVRRAYFNLSSEHKDYDPNFEGKDANFSYRNGLLVVAGHWDELDIYTPLDRTCIAALFDQSLELIISTDNKPVGEMIMNFDFTQAQTLE